MLSVYELYSCGTVKTDVYRSFTPIIPIPYPPIRPIPILCPFHNKESVFEGVVCKIRRKKKLDWWKINNCVSRAARPLPDLPDCATAECAHCRTSYTCILHKIESAQLPLAALKQRQGIR